MDDHDRRSDLVTARELRFPEVDQDLAEALLIDQEWLQQQADLLWERQQLIFLRGLLRGFSSRAA